MIARAMRLPAPRTAEQQAAEREREALLAALAHDRARQARRDTIGTVLLVCCFLAFVAVAVALRLL
jgi:hypothetical protein